MLDVIFKTTSKYFPLEVNSSGDVRNSATGNMRKIVVGGNGYCYVGTRQANYSVHRMVATLFIPNPNNLAEVNHIDGDKTNNCVTNLEWVDRASNMQHAAKLGLLVFNGNFGEDSNLCSYSDSEITTACELLAQGMRNCDVAKATGISKAYIKDLKANKQRVDITSKYTFTKFKKQQLSESTVRWVCSQIVAGMTTNEILHRTTSKTLNVNHIKNIRRGGNYSEISKDYF